MKNIIIIIVAILALGGLIYIGRPDGKNMPPPVQAEANVLSAVGESKYDFGSISMKNGVVNNTFQIRNDSAEPITIEKIYTSCMCTAAYFVKPDGSKIGPFGMPGHGGNTSMPGHGSGEAGEVLNPGETREIYVEFDPNAHGPAGVGRIARDIVVENSAGAPLVLGFSAMVTP